MLMIIGTALICYGALKLITKKSFNNPAVGLASLVAFILSYLLGAFVFSTFGYLGYLTLTGRCINYPFAFLNNKTFGFIPAILAIFIENLFPFQIKFYKTISLKLILSFTLVAIEIT